MLANKVVHNDCAASENNARKWQIKLNNGITGGQVKHAGCQSSNTTQLTANFEAISTPDETSSIQ